MNSDFKTIKTEKLMDRLSQGLQLTTSGKAWLTTALDPFHDNVMEELGGFPDSCTAPSVIQCVRKSVSVITPPGFTQSWNAHIVIYPWVGEVDMSPNTVTGCNVIDEPVVPAPAASIPQVCIYGTQNPTFDIPLASAGIASVSLGDALITGRGRLIGMGLEVINTTAELYKGGSIICYKNNGSPGPEETFQWVKAGDTFPTTLGTLCQCQFPPNSPAQALILPGSRQWMAKDGAYVVVPIQGNIDPFNNPNNRFPYFPYNFGLLSGVDVPSLGGYTVYTTRPDPLRIAPKLVPINQTGVMMTGLAIQTTFTVNVVWYYESFPSPWNDVLIPLARPSCGYDPRVLQIYNEVSNSLPVGVPLDWNESGDWWEMVVTAIRDYAPALGAIFGPEGALLGTGISAVTGLLQDKYMTPVGKAKAPTPPPKPKPKKTLPAVPVKKPLPPIPSKRK